MRNSIYVGWRNLPADIHLQDVTVTGGPAFGSTMRSKEPTCSRRAEPAGKLLPATVDWVLALPPVLRPHVLAARFARIANHLCVSWHDPQACPKYFEDLLTDRRGGRTGFPLGVVRELQLLSIYHARLVSRGVVGARRVPVRPA